MNFDFFLKFSKFHVATLVAAEDFTDKFNYQLTSIILIMFVTITGIRQYLFTPIQCWIPKEFDKAWEEYVENYCWVQDTYYNKIADGPPRLLEERQDKSIGYYQWVPFVLGLQALCFYTPHLLWKFFSVRAGSNVNAIVRYANEAATIDQDKKNKMISFLARQLEKLVTTKRQMHRNGGRLNYLTSRLSFLSSSKGYSLVVFYFIIKALYLVNTIGQLYLMRAFLGFNSTSFGADIFINLVRGRTWVQSGMFPRVTWCDFIVRKVGNAQRYSVQCVLPVNMLNEKIYIFLWFWITASCCMMIISIIAWSIMMLNFRNRKDFVKRFLRLLGIMDDEEGRKLAKIFINNYLRHDGVFLLRMIAHNAGDLLTVELIGEMWIQWRGRQKAAIENDDCNPVIMALNPDRSERKKPSAPSLKRKSTVNWRNTAGQNGPRVAEINEKAEPVAV